MNNKFSTNQSININEVSLEHVDNCVYWEQFITTNGTDDTIID